jgi:hypothetical protein
VINLLQLFLTINGLEKNRDISILNIGITTFFFNLKWAKNELGHINNILEIQEMSEKAPWTNEGDVSKLFGTHLGYMLMSKRYSFFIKKF